MEKYKIDERTGWEYELKSDYYYPTGRIMKNGMLTPIDPKTEGLEFASLREVVTRWDDANDALPTPFEG